MSAFGYGYPPGVSDATIARAYGWRDKMREWAEDHGYRHYRCNVCGWSGWTDGDPAAECYCGVGEEETETETEVQEDSNE